MVITVQLPTFLLVLYPIKAFRKHLSCCGVSRYHAIYVFLDTFQGHYKDGTSGSRDYRAASSISFLLRTLFYAVLSNFRSRMGLPMQSPYSIIVYCLAIASLFYGIIQPRKKKYMNWIESVVYCAAGLILMTLGSGHSYREVTSQVGSYLSLYLCLIILVLPSFILIFTIVAKILTCLCSCGCNTNAVQKWKSIFCKQCQKKTYLDTPDRLEHPLDYEPIS